MSAKISGVKGSAIRQIDQRIESDRFGVDMLTLVEEVQETVGFRRLGEPHENYPAMTIIRRSAQRGVGKIWRVTYTYEGYIQNLPEPTYELTGSLDQQPIETHPDFFEIAGKPSAPLNGAVFVDPTSGKPTSDDLAGVFREFRANLDGDTGAISNPKAGVDSFMDPGAMFTKTSFSEVALALRDLGTIETPSGDQVPTLSDRNWLLWEISSRRRGYITEIREVWKLSGRGGWDDDIYGASPPPP